MIEITVTHAVTGEAISVNGDLVGAVYRAQMTKISPSPVNIILLSGSAMLPIKESREEVFASLRTAYKQQQTLEKEEITDVRAN